MPFFSFVCPWALRGGRPSLPAHSPLCWSSLCCPRGRALSRGVAGLCGLTHAVMRGLIGWAGHRCMRRRSPRGPTSPAPDADTAAASVCRLRGRREGQAPAGACSLGTAPVFAGDDAPRAVPMCAAGVGNDVLVASELSWPRPRPGPMVGM